MALRQILLCALFGLVFGVDIDTFYEFGELAGDNRLQLGTDDIKRVDLRTPIAFYDNRYSTVYISDNGYLAFEEPASPDYMSEKFPMRYPAIGVFLGNSDTSWQGFVTYRENNTRALLQRASKDVRDHFTSARDFSAKSVLVVTWEYVGRFGDSRGEDANNYQVVVISDGTTSYCMFLYLDDGIQWLKSQENDPFAEAGFDKGDDTNYLTLPGSGQSALQASFVYGSNAGVRGMWLYQIGRVNKPQAPDTSNEALPESEVPTPDRGDGEEPDTGLVAVKPTCAATTSGCHTNAVCVDYEQGFCCRCQEPFYGNGRNCLEQGQPQRVNGKVSGTVNGVSFQDSDLHSYIVTAEGRAYTAISRVPGEVGPQLQLIFQTGGIISWLYAMTQNPAPNGMTMTGGTFNRTLTLRFGSQVVTLDQKIPGPDQHGYLQMFINVQGDLPDVHDNARINVDDFNYVYSRPRPGVLKSSGTRQYSVDGESREYTYDETVKFYDCTYRPREAWEREDLKVDVARLFVVYDKNQKVVRYAMSAKVTPANAKDPCADSVGKCHSAAECLPVGDAYRCECRRGYVGSGLVCQDRDECAEGGSNCNVNAQCYNTEGSFVCRCKSGYRGDGIQCEAERSTCADLTCDRNARCVFDPTRSQARCECNQGYRGDGTRCEREGERLCGQDRCDANARCVYDPDIKGPRCECNSGYSGTGVVCNEVVSLERLCAEVRCDQNARCTWNQDRRSVRCVCVQGYTGDGFTCQREATDRDRICASLRCDRNARCEYDERRNTAQCVCNPGYEGDGNRCREQQVNPCSRVRCDANARCEVDQRTNSAQCVCNSGYIGDGNTCTLRQTGVSACEQMRCHSDARCIYDEVNDRARCLCNSGFSGDGFQCRRLTDEERVCAAQRCHADAECLYEPITLTATCECGPGFSGDGRTCTRDAAERLCEGRRCHEFGQCVTHEPTGRERCLCRDGYTGNGYTECRREGRSCADVRCDVNARCTDDASIGPICRCNQGYTGDGYRCQRQVTCNEVDNCHPFARCEYLDRERTYACQCRDGYTGDGVESCLREQVQPTSTPPDPCSVCSEFADCRPVRGSVDSSIRGSVDPSIRGSVNGSVSCQCRAGFTGDGHSCTQQGDCNVVNNCDVNARCVPDVSSNRFRCLCNEGFQGNGYQCKRPGCDVTKDCHENAACLYDLTRREYSCKCNDGFQGDGKSCRELQCNQYNNCHKHARCVYNQGAAQYECRCKDGYTGDGKNCQVRVIPCNQVNNCDRNAECSYDEVRGSYACQCKAGFRGNGFRCFSSVDCRADQSICHQAASCVRYDDGYKCVCRQGFRGDGKMCMAEAKMHDYLIYTQGMSIFQVPEVQEGGRRGNLTFMIPEARHVMYITGQTAVGIDFDCRNLYFYYTDVSGRTIGKARLDGTDSQNILEGLGSPEGIAVDWLAGNVFWTDSQYDRIEVAKVDGTNRKTVIDTDLVNPRGIAVDPSEGRIYWTDWNRGGPRIESANMDGSERQVVVDQDLGLPNGIVYDYDRRRICWGDAGKRRIECANYDGSGRRTIYGLASYPFDLAILNNKIYWTDWEQRRIQNIDVGGGLPNEPLELPLGGNGKLYGIASVDKRCPRGQNACALGNGGCRYLCLPMPNGGRTCACPDDISEERCNQVNLRV